MRIDELPLASGIKIKAKDALVIVDVQNDFMPSGALQVKGGDEIVAPINRLAERLHKHVNIIVMTQDWHPPGHLSFASVHGKQPYDPYEAEGIGPVLWPDHCVQGSSGADFHPELEVKCAKALIRKGYNPKVDSYSAFIENDKKSYTGLSGYLNCLGISRIIVCGLALDYCVYWTALDGEDLEFQVVVPIDLTRPIDSPPGHLSEALNSMLRKGVQFTRSTEVAV